MSYKDDCRNAIEYLYKKMRKLEKKKSWSEKDSEEIDMIQNQAKELIEARTVQTMQIHLDGRAGVP